MISPCDPSTTPEHTPPGCRNQATVAALLCRRTAAPSAVSRLPVLCLTTMEKGEEERGWMESVCHMSSATAMSSALARRCGARWWRTARRMFPLSWLAGVLLHLEIMAPPPGFGGCQPAHGIGRRLFQKFLRCVLGLFFLFCFLNWRLKKFVFQKSHVGAFWGEVSL